MISTIKHISTINYNVDMSHLTDIFFNSVYIVSVNVPHIEGELVLVRTRDYDYASQLFDTIVRSMETVNNNY